MKQRDLAKAFGVDQSRISRYAARGMPTHDAAAARAWISAHVRAKAPDFRRRDQATEPPTAAEPATSDGQVSYAEARRRQAVADCLMAERTERQQAGELITVQSVSAALSVDFAATRDGLLQLPARLGPVLAAEVDPAKVERLLRAEIHQALTRLAAAPAALLRA